MLFVGKQSFLGLLGTLKVEIGDDLLHESGNAVVAEVADRTLVSVVNVLVRGEIARLNVESHLLVSIAERHTLACQAVYLLDGENRVVHRIVENILPNLHTIDNICGHFQAVTQFLKGWEEHLFYYLKVAEIATRQIVLYECDLRRKSLQLIALGTDELENVRILLVRHNA